MNSSCDVVPLPHIRRRSLGAGRIADHEVLNLLGYVLRMISNPLQALGCKYGIDDGTYRRTTLHDPGQQQPHCARKFTVQLLILQRYRLGHGQVRLIQRAQGIAQHRAGKFGHVPQARHDRQQRLGGGPVQTQTYACQPLALITRALKIDDDPGDGARQPQVSGHQLPQSYALEGPAIDVARHGVDAHLAFQDLLGQCPIAFQERADCHADLIDHQGTKHYCAQSQIAERLVNRPERMAFDRIAAGHPVHAQLSRSGP